MIERNPEPTESLHDPMPRKDRRTWWATLFLLCGLLGAMLGLSVKTQTAKIVADNADRLKGMSALLKANADDQVRIASLQKQIAQINAAPSDTVRVKLLAKQLAQTQFLAGLTDVKGPGVLVTMDDSKLPYPKDMPPGIPPQNIIHDNDIGQVVNELKAAGAEAISVNDQRLVAVSPIRCAGPTIFINNTPQTPPYVIKAIGDPKTLTTALDIPGGITSALKAFDPAMFKVEKSPKALLVPAYAGGIDSKYAVPATTAVASDADKKPGA